ncbi:MAG: RluA family pseudouridine synthase [Patescibacteria group bacterium]|nr:RluA family pseudouridine synthase [Patescibacteria group bacterium]
MFEKFTHIIKEADVGKRLDKYIVENFKDHSRALFQKMIKEGQILVNNKKVVPHHFLKLDDVVCFEFAPKESSTELTPNKKLKVPIIAEDENYLVISKPASMVVHPGDGHKEQDTLANWLVAYLPDIKDVGLDFLRPGIVHRLDRDASGLMVVAKTEEAYKSLRKQFDKGKITKEYTILVRGDVKSDGTIDLSLGRVKKGFKMVKKEGGREAITHYKVLEHFKDFSLLSVKTETGRMHQIRAHFLEIGHPVVGDKIYGDKTQKLNRLFLHASRLGFEDLKGKWREYEVDLSKELKDFFYPSGDHPQGGKTRNKKQEK